MSHNTNFQVTDPVKVYTYDPDSEFYIIGRVFYIDTAEDKNEYGVLYYGRHSKDLRIIHAAEDRLRKNAGRKSAWVPIKQPYTRSH